MTTNPVPESKSSLESIRDVLACEATAISVVAQRLNNSISAPLQLLFDVTGRIIFTGVGKMGYIGRKAAATFCSTGTPSIFLHAGEAVHGDLGIVTKDDVVVALSYSGQSDEVLNLLPYLQRFNIPVVSITGNRESELAKRSDYVIDIHVETEADHNELAPTASTTVALAVCDALAVSLAQRRGFTADQFAIFHPGGNLGRKLLLTTQSIMHTADDIPLARCEMVLREAIVVISEKRLGAVIVTDDQMQLLGILTDGDIRRVLQRTENPLQDQVGAVMSENPRRISAQSLAAEALRLMQEQQITVLPVVDENDVVCGIVHLHDLIKAGLA